MQTKNEFLLGIDPGSYKTGVAKVKPDGEVISAEWVETQTLMEVLTKLNAECGAAIKAVIIGNGTNTKPVHKVLGQVFTGVPVIEIDEKHSTEQARAARLARAFARRLACAARTAGRLRSGSAGKTIFRATKRQGLSPCFFVGI